MGADSSGPPAGRGRGYLTRLSEGRGPPPVGGRGGSTGSEDAGPVVAVASSAPPSPLIRWTTLPASPSVPREASRSGVRATDVELAGAPPPASPSPGAAAGTGAGKA